MHLTGPVGLRLPNLLRRLPAADVPWVIAATGPGGPTARLAARVAATFIRPTAVRPRKVLRGERRFPDMDVCESPTARPGRHWYSVIGVRAAGDDRPGPRHCPWVEVNPERLPGCTAG